MKTVRFGLVGCGLMAREFASASARWCHLNKDIPQPEIVGICSPVPAEMEWFKKNFPNIKYHTADYRDLVAADDIDVLYVAVPHNLHAEIYSAVIRSGKGLLGEKPFGIDKAANDEIMQAYAENPNAFIRCTSEFPYYPAVQTMINWYKEGKFGKILNVNAGFEHSSDMDLNKPINWKRMVKFNGEYGCLGDLGIHTMHVPFKLGFIPKRVYAVMSDIVKERPDGKGGMAPCETWDNATLVCDVKDADGNKFPMTLEMKRMKPGATNDWYLEVYGMKASVKFSSDDPNAFYFSQQMGAEQAWCRVVVGNKPQFPTATGAIFEFGFADSMLQMWASFLKEIDGQKVDFGCFRPEESAISHKLHTAALRSQKEKAVIDL